MSRTHNELSQVIVIAEPLDSNGVATTPTTARYRVDDCRTKKQLVDWTSLTPSTSMTIIVPGSANAIINSDRKTPEIKTVTVNLDESLATQHFAQYTYGVQDLGFAQVT